jgi:hypothetical protein
MAAAAAVKAEILNIAREDPFQAIAALVDDKQRQALKMQELEAKLDQLMSPPQQFDMGVTAHLKHALEFIVEHHATPDDNIKVRLHYRSCCKQERLDISVTHDRGLMAEWKKLMAFPLPGRQMEYGYPSSAVWDDMAVFMDKAFDTVRWGRLGWELTGIYFLDWENSECPVWRIASADAFED